MKLLILGGTRFLGRALVESALAQGDEVTLFNRGESNPGLFAELEQIRGDRDGGLAGLYGHVWDAVIDTCGYVPRLVGDSARLLADAVGLYTFISSISVYADPVRAHGDENAPLGTMIDERDEEVGGGNYGPLKVLCEQETTAAMQGRALLVRAGLLVGPYDRTDRFTYWPVRAARGGEILAPGTPTAPIQFIDVRDLAEWAVRATHVGLQGPYNVTGPEPGLTMQAFLEACQQEGGGDSSLTWVDEGFLLAREVAPWSELPLWIPAADAGFLQVDIGKALGAGLVTRPLEDTIRDTLEWASQRPADYHWQAGLPEAREMALLQEWHSTMG